jgi:glucose-1-phosphate cytidylyltransferase
MYRAHGFRRFLLLTGYRASQVAAFVAAEPWSRDVRVTCLDTGSDTPTGERVRLAAPRLDEERFCLAYADGVADSEEWVNAGFFCFERAALEVLEPGSVLEREPLERLAAAGQLRAFRHVGFWECMDTHKDWITLNALWEGGRALWSPIRPDEASPAPRTLRAAQPQLN